MIHLRYLQIACCSSYHVNRTINRFTIVPFRLSKQLTYVLQHLFQNNRNPIKIKTKKLIINQFSIAKGIERILNFVYLAKHYSIDYKLGILSLLQSCLWRASIHHIYDLLSLPPPLSLSLSPSLSLSLSLSLT